MTNAATVILHDAVGMRDESHGSASSSHWDGNDRIEVVLRRVYRRRGAGGNLRSGFSNGEGNACCLLAYCRGAQIPWICLDNIARKAMARLSYSYGLTACAAI
jgi:hypothetical protein